MQEATAGRLTANTCFIFMLLCFYPPFEEAYLAMSLFLLLTYPAVFIGSGRSHPLLRGLAGLIPAPVLVLTALGLLPGGLTFTTGAGLTLLYLLEELVRGQLDHEHWVYIKAYVVMSLIVLVFLIIITYFVVHGGGHLPQIVLAVTFLFFGALTLKALRWGRRRVNYKRDLIEVGEILLPPIAVGGAAGLVFYLINKFKLLIILLGEGIGLVIYGASEMAGLFMDSIEITSNVKEDIVEVIEEMAEEAGIGQSSKQKPIDFRAPSDKTLIIIILSALGLVLLFGIIRLLYNYLSYDRHQEASKDVNEEIVVSHERRSKRRKKRTPDNYAERIRKLYRDYLHSVRVRGAIIEKYDTSLDIMESAVDLAGQTGDADRAIRDLYIKARYADAATVTREDLDKMTDLCKSVTSS